MRRRASYWYQKAVTKLSGLPKEKAQKRIALASSHQSANLPIDGKDDAKPDKPLASRPKSASLLVAALDREAQECRSAKDALLIYKLFLADKFASNDAKDLVRKKLPPLEEAANRDYVRLGKNWVSREEVEKSRVKAESLVKEAIELMALKNEEVARQKLEKASQVDANGTRADFLLGVLSACNRNYAEAKSHFTECLRREPENQCTLNNIALTEVMVNDHQSAIKHLRNAIEIDSATPELAHNIHRILSQASARNLAIPSSTVASYSELFGQLLKQGNMQESARQGWLYMSPIVSSDEQEQPKADPPANPNPRSSGKSPAKPQVPGGWIVTSGGTGFVVQPHYVLTNRHVIEGNISIFVSDPNGSTDKLFAANVVAKSETPDLALLRCEELDAPAIPLGEHLPARGTDIMVLGYPEFFKIGKGLKSTRGTLVGLPDPETENMCLWDASTNHGNSGGPVCDNMGHVIAVVRVGFHLELGQLGGGIPIEQVLPFLSKNISDFHPNLGSTDKLDWPAVDGLASKSTVLIQCKGAREVQLAIGGKVHTQCIEDDGCVICRGSGKMRCPDCQNGTVGSTQRVVKYREPVTGTTIYEDKKIRVPCKTCNGTGLVTCPECHGSGRDPGLR